MWHKVDSLHNLRVNIRKKLGVLHFQIRKTNSTGVQNFVFTHLESISLPSLEKVLEKKEEENTSLVWVLHNGRRRVSVFFSFGDTSVYFKLFQFKENSFVLEKTFELSFNEYKKLVDFIPIIARTVHTVEKFSVNLDENAQSS